MPFRKQRSTSATVPFGVVNYADNLARGLVGWWPLADHAGATCVELARMSYPGTLTGAQTWTAGRWGGGFQFGNTNTQGFNLGNPPALELDYCTILCWVKPYQISRYQNMLNRDNGGTRCFDFGIDISNVFNFYVWNSSGTLYNTPSSTSAVVGTWSHIAMTVSSTTLACFTNGQQTGTGAFSGVMRKGAGQPIYIGYAAHDNNSLTGVVSDVRIYNRPLSQREILTIYGQWWRPLFLPRRRIISQPADTFRPRLIRWRNA